MKVFIASFLLTLAIGFGWQKLTEPDYQLRTVAYTVKVNDTVWGIAQRYMPKQDKHDDVRGLVLAIQNANNYDGMLQPGTVLRIPLETAK